MMPNRRKSAFAPFVACAVLAVAMFASVPARAQTPAPPIERSTGWDDATTIMALSSLGLQLVMPRVFYSDPEVTAGWKGRWHVSALAPIMTLATLTLVNHHYLKDSFESPLPGCDVNPNDPSCTKFGMFSSQSLLAWSAFGQGTGVFLGDTFKWSDGRFNAGAFTGNVAVPLVLAVITSVGRTSGNLESGGQVWASAGVGALVGLGTGVMYSLMQRPECGYTGSLLCW